MQKRTRWILIGGGLAIIAAVVIVRQAGTAIEVSTAVIRPDSLVAVVQEEGRTRVHERFIVAAPTTGRLARIAIEEGDWVAMGTLVARIFPAPPDVRDAAVRRAELNAAESRRTEAESQVRDAEQRAEQAKREALRSKSLFDAGAISSQAQERVELAGTSAGQQLEAARAALRGATAAAAAARAALMGTGVASNRGTAVDAFAPSAGRVLRVLEQSERVIQAGTPLVELGDAKRLEVVIDVLSEDAVRIPPAARVLMDGWGGDSVLTGQVQRVEPNAFTKVSALGVEEQRVSVIVDLDDTPAALGAGYRVEARIITWVGRGVLVVPTSALFQQDGGWRVFVVGDGRAALRTVRIGHRSAEAAEVVEGLQAMDTVIIFPPNAIADGVRVSTTARR